LTIVPNGANNRLTRWGGKTYSYDPNGNLLADGTHSYQWNERNQLTGLSAGATSLASFSYDSLGRRSAKTVAGATTGFVYDGDTFVQELLGASSNSAVKAQLLTGGIDETFLRIEGASRHSFLADGNNNTVRLLDANQAKVVDYTYEPYGRTTADATNGNTQQYTGRENDNPGNAGGLYYYRARYYMPGCARFISEDPIGWASGQTNNYAYVDGDPVNNIDPSGEILWAAVGGAVGAVGNFAWQMYQHGGNVSCVDWGDVAAWGVATAGVGSIVRGAVGAGARVEMGRWGARGTWSNNPNFRVPHFHWGKSNGLGQHHLPWQADRWWRNFTGAVGRGKAGPELANVGRAGGGAVAVGIGVAVGASSDGGGCGD
jgi:RHS repeat-associated protein